MMNTLNFPEQDGRAAQAWRTRRRRLFLTITPLLLSALLLSPAAAHASPSTALREYKEGRYDQALQEYKRLLEKKSDDPRLHFNAGAAAYRDGRFEEATNQFNAALSSPDLRLLESAYYNRGNSLYRLGEKSADPNQRSGAWESALKDYERSLKLNSQDPDARFNRDFVQKKLEQLKQQQSKQDKPNQQNKPNQQQQQDQQKSAGDESKKDQKQQSEDKQQQAEQNQQQQKPNPSQETQNQQSEQQKQDQQQQQAAQQSQAEQQQQQQQQRASAEQNKQNEEEQRREAAAYAAGQMTPEQAKQLLDAQKGEERLLPVKPQGKPTEQKRAVKDW